MSFREELEKKWKVSVELLEKARNLLSQYENVGSLIAKYNEYLNYNELEIALDMLEEIALNMENSSQEVWFILKEAAESMGLKERAILYEQKMKAL